MFVELLAGEETVGVVILGRPATVVAVQESVADGPEPIVTFIP
jgi:hypothetical protein